MSFVFPPRRIDDRLDYAVDWAAWLEDGEHIASSIVSIVSGDMTVSAKTHDASGIVRFWLSGGTAAQQVQKVAIEITTDATPPRTREIVADITIKG